MDHSKLYDVGLKKRDGEIKDSWQELATRYSDGFFSDGESYRLWVKNRLRNRKNLNNTKTETVKSDGTVESVEIHKDGSQSSSKLLEMSLEQAKDVHYILKAHGYDVDAWELISARNNIWNAYSKTDGVQTLYSSKISVKPKQDNFSLDEMKQFFIEMGKDFKSPVHAPIRYDENGKMLEVNIADLHVGKLCWSGDSNDTYDLEVARDRFFYIINDVLTRTQQYKFEKILFVWSNDFFHYDNLTQTTTAGTKQDSAWKYSQIYKAGTKMLVEAIDLLSQFAPVSTFYIGSNHDKQTSYCATEHLAAWFRNNPNVEVDTDPKIRKYVEFGDCLIQFSHGHAEGKRIGEVMSVEAKEAWGRTNFKEVHAGHFHSEKTVTKDNGVIVRYLGSPTGTDTWHYESGYIGAIKKGESFVWDRKKGLIDLIFTTVE